MYERLTLSRLSIVFAAETFIIISCIRRYSLRSRTDNYAIARVQIINWKM